MSKENVPITRRQFVAGSAAAAAIAGVSPSSFAEMVAARSLRLDAGYVPGSNLIPEIHAWAEPYMGNFTLVRADSFAQGDPRFLQTGARISIEDFVPVRNLPSLQIRAHFVVQGLPDGGSTIAFDAWSHDAKTHQTSRPIAFDVPILPERGARLTLDVGESSSRSPRVRPVRPDGSKAPKFEGFELSLSGDGPKLQRGLYVLAVVDADLPWSSFTFSALDPENPGRTLVRSTLTGREVADFPYFVVLVDHINHI